MSVVHAQANAWRRRQGVDEDVRRMEQPRWNAAGDASAAGESQALFFQAVPTVHYAVERACQPDWRIAPRRLSFYNLILLQEGELRAAVEGQEYRLTQSGEYILFTPGVHHSAVTNPGNLMRCYAFEFHLTHVASAQPLASVPLPVTGRLVPADKVMNGAHDLIRAWRVRPLGYEMRVRSLLLDILFEIFQQHHLGDIEPYKIRLVEEATRFIRANYKQKLTLADIAKTSSLSPTYFGSIFRRVTGQTPIEYLNRTRVHVAQDLLIATTLPVSEVAAAVGVEDLPYFSRMFKKYTGFSPSEYRRRH